MYRGLGMTLTVAVPNVAVSFGTYGMMREALAAGGYADDSATPNGAGNFARNLGATVVCAGMSGVIGTLMTFPVDVVRRRLQVSGMQEEFAQRSAAGEVAHILRSEGPSGMWRGITPELLKIVPMISITFLVYEQTKAAMGHGGGFVGR